MKQKTLHAVVKYFYPVAAGIETNMLETYRYFVENGWEVTVHTTTNTLTESGTLKKTESVKGINVLRYPWNMFGFFPVIPWESAEVVALHNFNIVPHTWLLHTILVRKVFGKRVPKIMLTPHGGFTPDWQIFSPIVATLKILFHYTVGTWLVNATVDIVRVVSDWEAKAVVSRGIAKQKVVTITNGIEDDAYLDVDVASSPVIKKQVKSYGTYMIQIGRIYNIKNYETTIKALQKLPSHINFVIVGPVGDEAYKTSLVKLIESLGLSKRVFFAGVVRGIDKYYLIKHAELMVHMARWESFCNAVHEGMSQGLPCIVADNTALPLLVKNNLNGFCVATIDVDELANKIKFILDPKNKKEVDVMKKNNINFGLSHSWKSVSEKIMSAIEKNLLSKNYKNKLSKVVFSGY